LKKVRWVISLLLMVYVCLWFSGNSYVAKALVYATADIDDYRIFDNRKIKAGTPQPWPLSSAYNKITLSPRQDNYFKELGTVALVAVKNDSLLFESYYDGYDTGSYSGSFSVAKSVVGLLTGIALQEGKIKSLDEPVSHYLPMFLKGEKSKITIRHLLTMSSGLNFTESYSTPFANSTEAYYGTNLRALIRGLEVTKTPGTQFRYKSGDTQILQMILEKATEMRLSYYFSQKLWIPLGAEHDALWSLDHAGGSEKAYCCINSNARDFARIGNLVLHNGTWKTHQLVDSNYIAQMFIPNLITDINGEVCNYYGLHWWITTHKKHQVYYARGILGQYIIVVPDEQLVIVRLGTDRGTKIGNHFEDTFKLIDFFSN